MAAPQCWQVEQAQSEQVHSWQVHSGLHFSQVQVVLASVISLMGLPFVGDGSHAATSRSRWEQKGRGSHPKVWSPCPGRAVASSQLMRLVSSWIFRATCCSLSWWALPWWAQKRSSPPEARMTRR